MAYEYMNRSYTGIEGIVRYVNDASGGVMTPLILLAIWLVVLVSQLAYGTQRALLSSSIVASLLAIILTALGMLSPTYMYLSFVVVGISIVLVRLTHNG
jgi:hypothetical protein